MTNLAVRTVRSEEQELRPKNTLRAPERHIAGASNARPRATTCDNLVPRAFREKSPGKRPGARIPETAHVVHTK